MRKFIEISLNKYAAYQVLMGGIMDISCEEMSGVVDAPIVILIRTENAGLYHVAQNVNGQGVRGTIRLETKNKQIFITLLLVDDHSKPLSPEPCKQD